jgi:uncharacterized Fe-S center protein
VALDKACLDLVFARPEAERRELWERITSRGGQYQTAYAEQLGLGTQQYELARL